MSYSELLERVRRVAAGLATRNLSEERPILILSGNSIEHLVLAFAAMWVGIPYCPMSPAYSLASSDLGKPTPDATGDITVNRATLFSGLPAGTYVLTISSIAPDCRDAMTSSSPRFIRPRR